MPWSRGEDFSGPLDGRDWSPAEQLYSEAARTSLFINLLTEDNLPSYHTAIAMLNDLAAAGWEPINVYGGTIEERPDETTHFAVMRRHNHH